MPTNILYGIIHALAGLAVGGAIFRFENAGPQSAPEECLASIFLGFLVLRLAGRSFRFASGLFR